MGYRIEYDNWGKKYEVRREKHILPGILALSGAAILLTLCFLPETAAGLRACLIPGEDRVTVQAFSSMADDLRSGAGLREALESFCRQVIHGR